MLGLNPTRVILSTKENRYLDMNGDRKSDFTHEMGMFSAQRNCLDKRTVEENIVSLRMFTKMQKSTYRTFWRIVERMDPTHISKKKNSSEISGGQQKGCPVTSWL
jgi:ABC-type lipoprotein export system ATPase subunit